MTQNASRRALARRDADLVRFLESHARDPEFADDIEAGIRERRQGRGPDLALGSLIDASIVIAAERGDLCQGGPHSSHRRTARSSSPR